MLDALVTSICSRIECRVEQLKRVGRQRHALQLNDRSAAAILTYVVKSPLRFADLLASDDCSDETISMLITLARVKAPELFEQKEMPNARIA